ncbi:conserved hypothetical protein [Hyphomicrobiales bacterium]|nr:conserved hypothetical protein [Hyphomicrobiales bacterium]CAH1669701.1 conserved hypothetical protein [Hyphomicrobiales bacterium]
MAASNDNIGPDEPLRLVDAVRYGFPHGGMTLSGLRKEAKRGRLAVERIAGKDFTTLRAIEEMRRLCHVQRRAPGSGSGRSGSISERASASPMLPGSFSTAASISPRDALLAKLSKRKSA